MLKQDEFFVAVGLKALKHSAIDGDRNLLDSAGVANTVRAGTIRHGLFDTQDIKPKPTCGVRVHHWTGAGEFVGGVAITASFPRSALSVPR
jgi:hypothetical protein